MGALVLFVLLVSTKSAYSDSLVQIAQYNNRADFLDSQVSMACGDHGKSRDPARKEFAERIVSGQAGVDQLMDEISQSSRKVNQEIENAESAVIPYFLPKWENKVIHSREVVEDAVQRLSLSERSGMPAVETERYRERVKKVHAQFKRYHAITPVEGILRDPELSLEYKKTVKSFRDHKTKELNALITVGSRVSRALTRATDCYCQTGGANCFFEIDDLKKESKWKSAYYDYGKSKYDQNNHKSPGSAANSSQAASNTLSARP